jgi:hypothetical protein
VHPQVSGRARLFLLIAAFPQLWSMMGYRLITVDPRSAIDFIGENRSGGSILSVRMVVFD